MKSVNLEGSHMAGVNLRVATLKNANLQNCDLRGAVLAGADLEVTKQQVLICRYHSKFIYFLLIFTAFLKCKERVGLKYLYG